MKPPVPYFGGKITLGPRIAALLPAHSHYVEPYCGSLAVLFAKAPSDHETVNDLDEVLMTFWRVLRQRPDDLARVCALTPHSRLDRELYVGWDRYTIAATTGQGGSWQARTEVLWSNRPLGGQGHLFADLEEPA